MPPRKTQSSYHTLLDQTKATVDENTRTKNFTHTRIPGDRGSGVYPGSYNITPDKHDAFMSEYYQYVFVEKNPEYLTEKQIPDGPILIDFDFRYPFETSTRQHTQDTIIDIMDLYLTVSASRFIGVNSCPFTFGDPTKLFQYLLTVRNSSCNFFHRFRSKKKSSLSH